MPSIPARRRNAPTVRFISLEIFATGVRAFECAFRARTSSFVHGLMTRRTDLTGAAFFAGTFFEIAFLTNIESPIGKIDSNHESVSIKLTIDFQIFAPLEEL